MVNLLLVLVLQTSSSTGVCFASYAYGLLDFTKVVHYVSLKGQLIIQVFVKFSVVVIMTVYAREFLCSADRAGSGLFHTSWHVIAFLTAVGQSAVLTEDIHISTVDVAGSTTTKAWMPTVVTKVSTRFPAIPTAGSTFYYHSRSIAIQVGQFCPSRPVSSIHITSQLLRMIGKPVRQFIMHAKASSYVLPCV
jgi:hypothetical protein